MDYGAVEAHIRADAALFDVKEIAYDPLQRNPHCALPAGRGREDGRVRQGFRSMAAPTRELEKLIVSQKLAQGGNPLTRWMGVNVAVA